MAETKKFREMTDNEIKIAFCQLANRCETCDDPKAAFLKQVKDVLECSYTVAITFSRPNGAGQRMHMGMVCSPSTSKTINF